MAKPKTTKSDDQERFPRHFVVGDINGRYDLFQIMMAKIREYGFDEKQDRIIFIGNWIGAGPDSNKIVDTFHDMSKETVKEGNESVCPYIFVRGANEQRFMTMGESFAKTAAGKAIIKSYRTNAEDLVLDRLTWAANKLDGATMHKHQRWMMTRHAMYWIGPHTLITSAGIDPDKKWWMNRAANLIYNASAADFLKSELDYGLRIVHGRAPSAKVIVKANRINVDTNALETDILSCAVMSRDSGKVSTILQTSKEDVVEYNKVKNSKTA